MTGACSFGIRVARATGGRFYGAPDGDALKAVVDTSVRAAEVFFATDATLLEGLEFLVRHAPPQLRLVLATRADPPLPLQRLRLSGQLVQVRAADLAFTVAEVTELLATGEDEPPLSEDDLALLQARTEGWIAGLRLAALSLKGQPDPHRFVTEFAGDDKNVADYLTREVLDQQPEELRGFLLRTCIVDELNGNLADALTGGHGGESMLARLEQANGFVTTVGSGRSAYRYHHLFAELLRYELRREAPTQVGRLHRRASGWYAARGLPAPSSVPRRAALQRGDRSPAPRAAATSARRDRAGRRWGPARCCRAP